MHVLGCGDELQVSVQCQGQVADTHVVVGARAGSKGQGQRQAPWQLQDPGCLCFPLAARSLPGLCIRQAACQWGISHGGLSGCLVLKQPQRPGLAASAVPGLWLVGVGG